MMKFFKFYVQSLSISCRYSILSYEIQIILLTPSTDQV